MVGRYIKIPYKKNCQNYYCVCQQDGSSIQDDLKLSFGI